MFVSWTPHSRPRDLAARLNAEYLVPAPFATSWWWPARYTIQSIVTIATILRRRPAVVLFTNPPFLAGVACLVSAYIVKAQCWADCHSGAYNDPRWVRFARTNAAVVRRCRGAVFHNALLAAEQSDASCCSVVLSIYAMTDRATIDDQYDPAEKSRPLVVAICSYGFDEPVEMVLEAAERVPQIDVAMTGRPPVGLSSRAPANVRFTGWLDERDYHDTIARASAVLCFTTREATMQNGLIEALEHRRPVVTSNTRALRQWAHDIPGVITVDHDPDALAATISAIADDREGWLRRAAQGQRVALSRAQDELRQLQDEMTAAGSA
jgi:glycosyltransferase involved in cell wall biosynthesis